jgi:hypothetical protein
MLRISKNQYGITEIIVSYDEINKIPVDTFLIIPGVTTYKNIYSVTNKLFFENGESYIQVTFNRDSDIERFYTYLMRDLKLNQILNIDSKNE